MNKTNLTKMKQNTNVLLNTKKYFQAMRISIFDKTFSHIAILRKSWSMIIFLSIGVILPTFEGNAQSPDKVWDASFGGSAAEFPAGNNMIIQTADGGFLIACRSGSPIDGNKTAPQIGSNDFWVVKTDANGNIQWQETYGGSAAEDFKGVSQTSDGGYILVGDSGSTDGDVSEAARGLTDYWMIKIDAVGTKQWDKRFGGTTNSLNFALNKARFAFETDDNGYMIGGLINSNMTGGDITEGVIGGDDMWVVKTDATGNMVWDQRLGTADADDCNHGIQTADGGYILVGSSFGGIDTDKTEANYGSHDGWVVKLDAAGNKVWDRGFGGSMTDIFEAVLATPDGGYLLGGRSWSPADGNKTSAGYGNYDYWVVKIDPAGTKEWENSFGGSEHDQLWSLALDNDGGFLLFGSSGSPADGNKTEASLGDKDYWVVKIDNTGNKVWEKAWGTSGSDQGKSIAVTNDGYIISGDTSAGIDGDKSQANFGGSDCWVLKTGVAGIDLELSVSPTTSTANQDEFQTFVGTITNASASTANNVQVRVHLPANRTFIQATPSQGTYDPQSEIWNIGDLASGSQTLSITIQVQ